MMKSSPSKNEGDKFLLVKGICADKAFLTNEALLLGILNELPSLIGMKPIREPMISKAGNNPGLEGYVPIDESNITISTYTKKPRFVACIHSCKYFDNDKIIDYLRNKFRCKNIEFLSIHESDFI